MQKKKIFTIHDLSFYIIFFCFVLWLFCRATLFHFMMGGWNWSARTRAQVQQSTDRGVGVLGYCIPSPSILSHSTPFHSVSFVHGWGVGGGGAVGVGVGRGAGEHSDLTRDGGQEGEEMQRGDTGGAVRGRPGGVARPGAKTGTGRATRRRRAPSWTAAMGGSGWTWRCGTLRSATQSGARESGWNGWG